MLFAVGMLSTLLSGYICNKHGRKATVTMTSLVGSIGLCTIVVSNTYWGIFTGYCLAGFTVPFMNFGSLYLNELGNESYRASVNSLY